MRVRRWATIWLVAMMAATTLGATPLGATARGQYQYDDGLPTGVLQITVDGQAISPSTTPRTSNQNPVFAGRLEPGPTAVELAIGNGEIVRFTVEVDEGSGRFQGRAPDELAPGTYSLFIDDEVVGDFEITEEGASAAGAELLDLASLVPFPEDLASDFAGIGFIDGGYASLTDEARERAEATGGGRDAITQVEQQLAAAGWQGRYDGRLAIAQEADPTQFDVLVTSRVIEYAAASGAGADFAASAQGEVVEAETIGEESRFTRGSGVTSDTGAAFQSLQLTFRQDRLLFVIVVGDLLNREPDLAAVEALGQTLRERAEAQLADGAEGLSRKVLRLDLSATTRPDENERYEVLDGETVAAYNEEARQVAAREASYAGAIGVYAGTFEARLGETGGDTTPAADEGGSVLYSVTIYAFADEDAAETWLDGLGDRLEQDPVVRRYLAFSPLDDFPTFGDGTTAYSLSRESRGETASGFRFYVRVGDEVAQIELAADPDAPRTAVEELAEAQAACLEADACPDLAPLPSGVGVEAAG